MVLRPVKVIRNSAGLIYAAFSSRRELFPSPDALASLVLTDLVQLDHSRYLEDRAAAAELLPPEVHANF